MRNIILTFLFVALSISVANAQIKRISGSVTTSGTGVPVSGVSVVVKGTTLGTVTNQDGYYQLNLSGDSPVLVFSYIGMKTRELPVEGSILDVAMIPDNVDVDEVVVVAYGTTVKNQFTGSVSSIDGARLEQFQTANFTKALQGLSAGVLATSGSGQPGEDADIRIRGFSTFGDASPLVVLDGFPYDGSLSALPLSEIESVSILKDASATVLYGSRAANGVIIITTKSGTKGPSKLDLKVSYGISNRAIPDYDKVTVPEYYELQWEGIRNALVAGGTNPDDANSMASQQLISVLGGYNAYNVPAGEVVDENGAINPDAELLWNDSWQDQLFVTGQRKEVTINSSGGTDKTTYFLSGGMLDEGGIISASNLKRFSARANIKTQIRSWINAGINLSGSLSEQNYPVSSGSSYLNSFMFSGLIAPIYPVYLYNEKGEVQTDAEGNKLFDFGTGFDRARAFASNLNPLGTITHDKREYKKDVFTLRSFINFELAEGLSFNASVGADYFAYSGLTHQNMKYGDGQNFNGRSARQTNRMFSYTANQLLRYVTGFGGHSVNAMAGHESYSYKLNTLAATRSGFPFPELVELDAAAIPEKSGSSEDNYRLESYLVKVEYDYDKRFFASFNMRADGNSRFAENARWGSFWGMGLSWIISHEEFLQDFTALNLLRIKASYGEQGNDKVGSYYGYQGLYKTGVNNIDFPGILASRLPTPVLTWESLNSLNMGVEAEFLNRYSINFEYYIRNNSDLLFEKPLPPSTGFTSIDANIAELSNVGFDLELGGLILNAKNVVWNLDLNLGHFKNKIKELPQKSIISGNKLWQEGASIYDFWVEEFAGVDSETGKTLWRYTDADTGEKGVTTSYSKATRYYAGSAIPDLFGGINNTIKIFDFDLSVLLSFGIGGKVMDSGYQWLMHSGQYGYSFHRDILDRWTPENSQAIIPAIDGDSYTNRRSSRFLTDASYFNLKNISLGYNFPEAVISKLNLAGIKLKFTADNLALATARKGLDPQFSLDGSYGKVYVPIRTLSVGVDVQF
ncbi:TonB-linked outer membrane protein, SusC/RagA family [Mariniphaga anaerophila]|uniref:TonB-linked outer membrane protein, SusC/RagA family n=1 Tax=Mariniphaga anaerophila TaxID=1484053 RepID=A0A1M5F6P8_9BACT|nr:SusC/RagA family TonB-linked outer membrane protein [Mariniphaga anaerophila]SHF87226.1 TonB-linked outer membrane protein, SusC/RagA family [Mariniphaga anaerophila]